MMIEPQKLDYVSSDFDPPAILARFHDQDYAIEFPVSKVHYITNSINKEIVIIFNNFRLLRLLLTLSNKVIRIHSIENKPGKLLIVI